MMGVYGPAVLIGTGPVLQESKSFERISLTNMTLTLIA